MTDWNDDDARAFVKTLDLGQCALLCRALAERAHDAGLQLADAHLGVAAALIADKDGSSWP